MFSTEMIPSSLAPPTLKRSRSSASVLNHNTAMRCTEFKPLSAKIAPQGAVSASKNTCENVCGAEGLAQWQWQWPPLIFLHPTCLGTMKNLSWC
jgi:hypothetical protein